MPRLGLRFKMWWLMAAVAIVAVCFAAARNASAPNAVIAMIGSCVACLAYKRYSEAVALRQARGVATSRTRKAGLLLASAAMAAVVIGLSDIAFLAGYYGYMEIAVGGVVSEPLVAVQRSEYTATGAVFGMILALCVASSLRYTVWPLERAAPGSPRRWYKLWPVVVAALVALALGLEWMRLRWQYCMMRADYYATAQALSVGPKEAARYARLKRWYEKAALRPWLPIPPDHIPPGL
jgi:hypothetical protein